MPRVKRGVTARARHKKIMKLSKGFILRRNNVFRVAKQAVMKAGQYAYRDRRNKPVNTLIVTAATRSAFSVACGSLVSMPALAPTA